MSLCTFVLAQIVVTLILVGVLARGARMIGAARAT
jgi:hypothetical protein